MGVTASLGSELIRSDIFDWGAPLEGCLFVNIIGSLYGWSTGLVETRTSVLKQIRCDNFIFLSWSYDSGRMNNNKKCIICCLCRLTLENLSQALADSILVECILRLWRSPSNCAAALYLLSTGKSKSNLK